MQPFFIFLILLLFLEGCSTHQTPQSRRAYQISLKKAPPQKEHPPYHLHTKNAITNALYDQYKKWYGVQYCYGGDNKHGIDCSALVQIIYKDAFNINIPRTTLEQAKSGYRIKKAAMKEGDLILFTTGYHSHHSGIYIEKGNFIHSSSSNGVTISNVNNPYWRSKYWQTRRVLAR